MKRYIITKFSLLILPIFFCINPIDAQISANVTICLGNSTVLTTGGSFANFVWSPAQGLNYSTGQSVIASPSVSTIYRVNGFSVFVYVPKLICSAAPALICPGQPLFLRASGVGAYSWAPNYGLSQTTGTSVLAKPLLSLTYTLIGFTQGCPDQTLTIPVSVDVLPTLQVSSSFAGTLCQGETSVFTASGSANYSWLPFISLSSSLGNIVTAKPTISTTYSVLAHSPFGCTALSTKVLSIYALPSITTTFQSIGDDLINCLDDSITLISHGLINYTWSPAYGLNITSGSTVIAKPSVSTNYTFSGNYGNTCTYKDSFFVKILTMDHTPDSVICEGEVVSWRVNAIFNGQFEPPPYYTNYSQPGQYQYYFKPITTTTYTLTGTNYTCRNEQKSTLTAFVYSIPTITSSTDATICLNTSTILTVNGATNYLWEPFEGLNSITGESVSAMPKKSTTYTIRALNPACASSQIMINVKVIAVPTCSTDDVTLCQGGFIPLRGIEGVSYTWLPAMGLDNTFGEIVKATPTIATTYTMSGSNSCFNGNDTIRIELSNLRTILSSPDASICSGFSYNMTASGFDTYLWYPTNAINFESANSVIANPLISTNYMVSGISSECSVSRGISIFIYPPPFLMASPAISICSGSAITLTANGFGIKYCNPRTIYDEYGIGMRRVELSNIDKISLVRGDYGICDEVGNSPGTGTPVYDYTSFSTTLSRNTTYTITTTLGQPCDNLGLP